MGNILVDSGADLGLLNIQDGALSDNSQRLPASASSTSLLKFHCNWPV